MVLQRAVHAAFLPCGIQNWKYCLFRPKSPVLEARTFCCLYPELPSLFHLANLY